MRLRLAILAAALAACASADAEPPREGRAPSTRAAQEEFVGTVVYETSAAGTNQEGAELFSAWGPGRVTVVWGRGGKLRLEEKGGLSEGAVVADLEKREAYRLEGDSAERVSIFSFDDPLEPEVKALLGDRYGPAEVEATAEERTVAGHRCRMYVIRRSGMLRRGATGRACVAEGLRFRPTRYVFEAEWTRMGTPLPLQFGIREGAVLFSEVNEDGTLVTYTAVSVTPAEPADSLFAVPAGYRIKAPPAN